MSLYADDRVLCSYNTNLQDLEKGLNEDLLTVAKWEQADFKFRKNQMYSMLLGSNHKLGKIRSLSVFLIIKSLL